MPVGAGSSAARARQQQPGQGYGYDDDDMNRGDDNYDDDGGGGGEGYGYDDGRGGGTFITAQAEVGAAAALSNKELARRERARKLELATAGQKNLRGRLQNKRGRAKEQMIAAKKHETAMKELARRKHEMMTNRKGGVAAKAGVAGAGQRQVRVPAKGIASGARNKNKHLQEFENMKANYKRKKGTLLDYGSWIYCSSGISPVW
jgi:hypothetical protein